MTDVLVLLGIAALVGLAVLARRRADGRVRAVGDVTPRVDGTVRAALGAPAGGLLVEMTAPGCVTCAAAKRVLDEVAGPRDGWSVVQADVGDHLDFARAHGVLRAPTTLVVDAAGVVRHRISGVPDDDQLIALLEGPNQAGEDSQAA